MDIFFFLCTTNLDKVYTWTLHPYEVKHLILKPQALIFCLHNIWEPGCRDLLSDTCSVVKSVMFSSECTKKYLNINSNHWDQKYTNISKQGCPHAFANQVQMLFLYILCTLVIPKAIKQRLEIQHIHYYTSGSSSMTSAYSKKAGVYAFKRTKGNIILYKYGKSN